MGILAYQMAFQEISKDMVFFLNKSPNLLVQVGGEAECGEGLRTF